MNSVSVVRFSLSIIDLQLQQLKRSAEASDRKWRFIVRQLTRSKEQRLSWDWLRSRGHTVKTAASSGNPAVTSSPAMMSNIRDLPACTDQAIHQKAVLTSPTVAVSPFSHHRLGIVHDHERNAKRD